MLFILATCVQKPKAPFLSPAASYVQRWSLCSNRPANVKVSVNRVEVVVRVKGVKAMPSPFHCSTVIRECSWKKTQLEKKEEKKRSS